jgi:ATP-dependent DNA helicase RecG
MLELPNKESLTVEFKSDRKRLPDLVTTAVAMANTEGGVIYLGMEDDGTATGLHVAHQPPDGIAALVGNRIVPSVQVRIETLAVEGKTIAKISVPKVNQVVATTAGSYFKRRLKHDGSPESVPILPHDIPARLSQLGAQDVSRQPVAGENAAARTLETLREHGLAQSHGRGSGSNYTLSPQVYASLGAHSEYVRQAGCWFTCLA